MMQFDNLDIMGGWLVVGRMCFRDPYGLQGFVYQHIFAWVAGWRRTEFKQENKQEEKEIKMEVFRYSKLQDTCPLESQDFSSERNKTREAKDSIKCVQMLWNDIYKFVGCVSIFSWKTADPPDIMTKQGTDCPLCSHWQLLSFSVWLLSMGGPSSQCLRVTTFPQGILILHFL